MPRGDDAQDERVYVGVVMYFEDYLKEWAEKCRTNVGESWCKTQDILIKTHILPILQRKILSKITASDISEVLSKAKIKGLSAKTRLHLYTILFSLFDSANAFFEMDIKSPVKPKFHRPKVPKKKAAFMSPMQTYVLLEYVMHSRYGPAIWMMALSGLRISEMLPRKWGDIDFDNEHIWIKNIFNRGSGKRGKIQAYMKNGEQVYAPIAKRLKAYLKERQCGDDEYILKNKSGDMFCYYNFRRWFRRTCKALKLPISSVHGLRHSCTEIWVTHGATHEDIRRLLNHLSLDATAGYIHRTDDRLRAIGKKIA